MTTLRIRGIEVGDRGQADSPLRPAGRIKIGSEYVDVVADGSFIDSGYRSRGRPCLGKPNNGPRG